MATQELQEQSRHSSPDSRRVPGSVSYDLSASAASAVRRTTGLLRRHKLLIGTVIVIGTGLAAFVAFRMTPLYTAETLIMVEHRKNTVLNFEGVVSDMTPDISALQSEVAILKSPAFAEKVVRKLGLMNDPEFNAALRPEQPAWLTALNPRNWIPASWRQTSDVALSPEEVERNRMTAVINAVLDNTSVRPQGRSYVIAVSFDSEDPRKSSLIANTMADLYLVDQLDTKFTASKRATQWLEERLTDLRKEAQTTGDAVEKYRTEHGLTTASNENTVVSQQLSALNADYILARSKRQEAETKLREVTTLANSPRGVSAVGDVLGSPLIQALREREVDLQRQIADATNRYGSKHPVLQAMQSQLRDLQGQIKSDVAKIVANLGNEVDLAKGREQALKTSLDQLEAKQNQQQEATVGLRTLERDASTAQSMYEALLTRSQQIAAQTDMRQPDARVVSEAAIPLDPSQPNRKLMILLALVASGTLGVLLAMLRERAESGFRSPHQFELATGVRSLGIVPRIPRFGGAPASYIVDKPVSAFAESMQNLRTSLLLANPDGRHRVILFSSSVPGEGKSSVAAAFARTCANAGQRTILVDCDLRRKCLHDMLGLANNRGLSEVLAGTAALEDVIQVDPRTGLHVISAGHGRTLPQDTLGSSGMHQLLSRLSVNYDRVVLDSPPVLAVSEGKLLAALADQTVFIVRWGQTKRGTAMAGLKEVIEAGGEVVGVLFSQVDTRRHAQYEFPDSGRYHGYRRYYAN
ncbi:GumC family protein [Azospirillum picis]|uniref:non-specific protein-tyrosine kinase n=1 Tax=Azospirillum picis TaxID=488438 RepID=A0ABU0ME52_9PROT|nr:Wzz/FepE/Etk N-terminal domain-containing protein [Azospirillum picis]MBP2297438.1 capsular exopolysaccharide synthesis family protein [Azospirillum picis]MDQ0531539.1 capsular exopolysaccharide synthesis family protein [Azospirillum picis]